MFIGHFGAAFAAKKIDKSVSLGTLIAASQFIDLLWPVFLILGIEKVKIDPGNTAFTPLNFIHYPFSHSFFSVLIWGILFGGVYYLLKKNLRGAIVTGSLVISHWILDLLTHRPDLPIFPWSETKAGLGLWNSVLATLFLETGIFIAGVWIYLKTTRQKFNKGGFALYSLVSFLLISYLMNVFGPPPTSEEPIAYVTLSMWLFVLWGYWTDRNRESFE